MWFRGTEFRALIIEAGKIVAFIPTDAGGKKRTGVVVRLHDEDAAKIASAWHPNDRIFFYHDDAKNDIFEGGYFNERTSEKIRVS